MNMMGLGETVIIFDPEDIKEMYRYGKRKDIVIFKIKCLVVLSWLKVCIWKAQDLLKRPGYILAF